MRNKPDPSDGTTASELIAELNADPEFVAARARREADLQRRQVESQRAQAALLDALRKSGHAVDSVWDLVNTAAPYPAALPILLEHLARPYPDGVREGIARALAVPEAKFGWERLVQLYRSEGADRVRDGLAVAIAACADGTLVDEVIALVQDTRLGPSRLLLLRALERWATPQAQKALTGLQSDPDLSKEIRFILRRLGRRT